jgi:hypothetical protein
VNKYRRTLGSEGATELGRNGPRPVGLSRLAWPTPGSVPPPPLFLAHEDT